jgi:hypothetical protein
MYGGKPVIMRCRGFSTTVKAFYERVNILRKEVMTDTTWEHCLNSNFATLDLLLGSVCISVI